MDLKLPKLVFAADAVDDPTELRRFVRELMQKYPEVWVKFGLGWVMTHGLHSLAEQPWLDPSRVFLDLKILDIDATMKTALEGALNTFKGRGAVGMINIHATKGETHLRDIASHVRRVSPDTFLVGVTVLTDMDQEDLNSDTGLSLYEQPNFTPTNLAIVRAKAAKAAGLNGVVCSPQEVAAIKQFCGKPFLTVVPGIRPAEGDTHDQKRVGTPRQAVVDGADFLVVGRPIWEGTPRLGAVEAILNVMDAAKP